MCHPRVMELEPEEKNTMQQHAAYNNQQWNYFNELMLEIFKGNYGDYYDYLLAELTEGPYWPLVKARLGQPREEYDPDKSVSGSREPSTEDDTSSEYDSSDWEYASEILGARLA